MVCYRSGHTISHAPFDALTCSDWKMIAKDNGPNDMDSFQKRTTDQMTWTHFRKGPWTKRHGLVWDPLDMLQKTWTKVDISLTACFAFSGCQVLVVLLVVMSPLSILLSLLVSSALLNVMLAALLCFTCYKRAQATVKTESVRDNVSLPRLQKSQRTTFSISQDPRCIIGQTAVT